MQRSKIFHVGKSTGTLTPMEEQPYGREVVIQELLARHPDLLAGDQITADDPRRWLLVTREMPVPDSAGGSGRQPPSGRLRRLSAFPLIDTSST